MPLGLFQHPAEFIGIGVDPERPRRAPWRRREKALLAVIRQAYVEGVSNWRVDDLADCRRSHREGLAGRAVAILIDSRLPRRFAPRNDRTSFSSPCLENGGLLAARRSRAAALDVCRGTWGTPPQPVRTDASALHLGSPHFHPRSRRKRHDELLVRGMS